MAFYVQPVYNLRVNIWRFGNAPPMAPDVVSVGNLSPGKLGAQPPPPYFFGGLEQGGMWLRLPAGTDIRDIKAPAGKDTCEVPSGSGRMYTVEFVDDIGGGFSNEHRFAQLQGKAPWPVPFPSPSFAPPVPGPPAFGAAFGVQTAGVPVQLLICPAALTVTTNDRNYCLVTVFNFTGPGAILKADGAFSAPILGGGPFVSMGVTYFMFILEGPNVAGAHNFSCDFGLGNIGQITMQSVLLLNAPPVTVGAGTNANNFTPPVQCLFGGGEVLATVTPAFAAVTEVNLAGPGQLFTAPFLDFAAPLTEVVTLVPCSVNFGGFVNPPIAPLTAVRNAGATLDQWAMLVFAKH